MEAAPLGGACTVDIKTTVKGYAKIWQAVLEDFFARYDFKDTLISINDFGATPAVVSLRLDQGAEEVLKGMGS